MKLDKSEFPLDNDKSCPFCASRVLQCEEENVEEGWICWCANCGASGPNHLSWSDAIEMWNLRRPYDKLEEKHNKTLIAIEDIERLVEEQFGPFEKENKND